MGIGVALLVTRLTRIRGNILDVTLGRYAWPLVGKPQSVAVGSAHPAQEVARPVRP